MKYEIINPSDEAYIEADEHKIAATANILLGGGQYGLKQVDGDFEMPVFAKAQWFRDTFGETYIELCDAHVAEIKVALETVCLAGERTSLNDIVKYAKSIAKQL